MGFTPNHDSSHHHHHDDHHHHNECDVCSEMSKCSIQDLSDVDTAAPTNGQHLVWNASNAVWTNNSLDGSASGISAQVGNLIVAGSDGYSFLDAAIIKANETVTVISADYLAKTFTYVNEAGVSVVVDMSLFDLSPDVVVTTDGTGTGVSQSGILNHTIDITVLSADALNALTTGTDGGVFSAAETVSVVTTDGTATGVTQSGTSDHVVDIALLSTDALNALTTGTDGGVFGSAETTSVVTTDGTATGVSQSGTADHIVDIVLLSTDALNASTTGTDGGVFTAAETVSVVTTDGTATGVSQSGTSDHVVDITLLSADAANILSSGVDGGVFLADDLVPLTTALTGPAIVAVNNTDHPVNTTGSAITVTPPAAPVVGDKFSVFDALSNAATNNISIDFTGTLLNGVASTLVLSADRDRAEFKYFGGVIGWSIN